MIICTPDIFFHPISVMDFKKIFSVVVCAVGIFFSMTAGSKDECLNSYVSADSLLRTGELETVEVMFRKGILEDVDSFPAREIIAMCMNSDWSGSTYIMEHEPDKYDSMYTEYFFSLYY